MIHSAPTRRKPMIAEAGPTSAPCGCGASRSMVLKGLANCGLFTEAVLDAIGRANAARLLPRLA
jgi:hypothetical protein